jgi:hypothetical protein
MPTLSFGARMAGKLHGADRVCYFWKRQERQHHANTGHAESGLVNRAAPHTALLQLVDQKAAG